MAVDCTHEGMSIMKMKDVIMLCITNTMPSNPQVVLGAKRDKISGIMTCNEHIITEVLLL